MRCWFCLGLFALSGPAVSLPSGQVNTPPTARLPRPRPAVLDTLLRVNGHALHFTVWPGRGPALLFEAGGGDDLSVWKTLLAPLSRATVAPLIACDRAEFGRSGLDSSRVRLGAQVADLHAGLAQLPGPRRYVLVGHSFGGYCATVFAARYPRQVAGAVLVDANHVAYFMDARIRAIQAQVAPGKRNCTKQLPVCTGSWPE